MNITYLLGAGASANALPIVNKIPERLNNYVKDTSPLTQYFNYHSGNISPNRKPIVDAWFNHFIKNVKWVVSEINYNRSIDQFAYTLFHNGSMKDLDKLKSTLNSFFMFEQLLSDFPISFIYRNNIYELREIERINIDHRYEYFWTLIEKRRRSNSNDSKLNILNWNYDLQLELSYQTYLSPEFKDGDQIRRHIINELLVYPNYLAYTSPNFNNRNFSITKLNGTAGFYKDSVGHFYGYGTNIFGKPKLDFELVLKILEDNYYSSNEKLDNANKNFNTISFAWENESLSNPIIKEAVARTIETEVLVVIGYSFPDYNRVIDNIILDNMRGLKKVFIQDINNTIIDNKINIIEKILKGKVEIEGINQEDKFYIPQEFHQVQL